jgi:hypothetical protein
LQSPEWNEESGHFWPALILSCSPKGKEKPHALAGWFVSDKSVKREPRFSCGISFYEEHFPELIIVPGLTGVSLHDSQTKQHFHDYETEIDPN